MPSNVTHYCRSNVARATSPNACVRSNMTRYLFTAGANESMGTMLQQQRTPKLLEVVVRVPRESVKITRKIGEGAFGEVSQAQVFPYGTVAIKWLKVG